MKKMLIRLPDDVAAGLETYVQSGQRTAFVVEAVRRLLLLEEEREAARRSDEHAKRVEEAKEFAPRILDGLEAAGTPVDQWIVEGKHDGGPLMGEVIRLWRERREAGGAGE